MIGKKYLFYSHDTLGLGHIRRTQKLANHLVGPNDSALILCSSPKANSYTSSKGIEFLKLPGFAKLSDGTYKPRNMNIPLESFVQLRSDLILQSVKTFQPDIFIIDKEPLGVKKELLKSINYLRDHTDCKIICGFRDILDSAHNISNEWRRRQTLESLDKYFDSIFVYGSEELYSFKNKYNIPEEVHKKFKYVGYIKTPELTDQSPSNLFYFPEDKPLISFTLGGGEDGVAFFNSFLETLKEYPLDQYNFLILSGPFLNINIVKTHQKSLKSRNNIKIYQFVPNMLDVIRRSDLIITMGGYNTVVECVGEGKKPLIIPRITPREEQLIRAETFRAIGLCDYIHPRDFVPQNIYRYLSNLDLKNVAPRKPSLDMKGLDNTKRVVQELFSEDNAPL